ncbi:MAG: hypothetical protein LBG15_03585 [Dysgonamonadaceae bacterium]|jgi:hypothetical protein|nr:hypothetical protein [Dysgonamonadaceae bacterium]
MNYNSEIHHRCSIRLKGYDYSREGLYFITVCTQNSECLFGEIIDGEMILNDYGKIVELVWNELPQHYSNVQLDVFVVMPNHIHGIIAIVDADVARADIGVGLKPAPTMATTNHALPEIVRALKTFSSRKI